MFDSIAGVAAVGNVSGAAGAAASPSADGGLSALRGQSVDAGRQADLARQVKLEGTDEVSMLGLNGAPSAMNQPLFAISSIMNKPDGPNMEDMVNLQLGLMNYSMSMTIMTQSHKKISESKSALMNEGKNA
jgi:hypothetical protein